MGHFKEIETGLISIVCSHIGPNMVETNKKDELYIKQYLKNIIPPYPHPRGGNKNPAYGILAFPNTILMMFYHLYYKSEKTTCLPGANSWKETLMVSMIFDENAYNIGSNISAAGVFLENEYTTRHVFYEVMFVHGKIRVF